MTVVNIFALFQIGDSTRYFQNSVARSRAQIQSCKRVFEQQLAYFVQFAVRSYLRVRHLVVCFRRRPNVSVALNLSRSFDSVFYDFAAFVDNIASEIVVRDAVYFNLQIYSVEKRSG